MGSAYFIDLDEATEDIRDLYIATPTSLSNQCLTIIMGSFQPAEPHVLIIGAGITGLLLAQSLRKEGTAFSIYERDPTPTHRGAGWGLALHWALDTFLSLVPQELRDRLPETYVDPITAANDDNGRFPFFDLSTGKERYENLSPKRVRLSREKLRRLLMHGVEIEVRPLI